MKNLKTYYLYENSQADLDQQLYNNVYRINLNKVRQLLKQGANPNINGQNNWTPLHNACIRYDKRLLSAIKYLLAAGADINAQSVEGNTPILIAAMNDELTTVQLLLKYKPDLLLENSRNISFLEYCVKMPRLNSWVKYLNGIDEILQADIRLYNDISKVFTIPPNIQKKYEYAKNGIDLNLI